jgi:DNA polymerase-3 subunit gamma/tau
MARKKPITSETAPVGADSDNGTYTVVARRYRPQKFEELVGQDAIAQALENAIKSNRVAHAYLFTGARGVGKTSTARILAKCLNCVKGPTTTPCNECDLCKAISAGEDVDVLEIDGASNNGVDQVRELRSNVQYRPQRSRYKIYIIDEVHMLSTAAFNALLKTLEEPPPHVKFIFATTDTHKIPITILSRCQRFDFTGISLAQIKERLKQIVEREGMLADDEALDIVARRAGGSMRDAQSLLDQLLAFGGEKLTVERVHELLGTAHEERIAALAEAILAKDAKQALALIAEAADRGLQLGELLDQLVDYWRDLMVVQAAGAADQSLSVTGANRDKLQQQAANLSSETILAGLDVLVTAKSRLRTTSHGRIVLEMAIVRLARLDDLVGVSQLVQLLQDGGVAVSAGRPTASSPRLELEKKKVAEPVVPAAGPIELTAESLPQVWQQLSLHSGFAIKNLLSGSVSQAIFGPNALVARFPKGYNLPGETARVQLEELVGRVTGQKWSVRLEATAEAGTGSASRNEQLETPMQKRRRQQDEVLKMPVPARARDALGAQLVEMDEGFGAAKAAAPQQTVPVADEEIDASEPVDDSM